MMTRPQRRTPPQAQALPGLWRAAGWRKGRQHIRAVAALAQALIATVWLLSCDGGAHSGQPSAASAAAGPSLSSQPPAGAASATSSASAAPAPAAPQRTWLEQALLDSDPRFAGWLEHAAELRLQILVKVMEPGGQPGPSYQLRADAEYFYPASAIKIFLAIEALRHTSKLSGGEISLNTRIMRCRIGKPGCKPLPEDAEKDEEGKPKVVDDKKKHDKFRIGQEIRKMLSYSDNDSFNRLYDIIGHRALNEGMGQLGFDSVRFQHKMNAPAERSRKTPRVLLMPPGKKTIVVALRDSDLVLAPTTATSLSLGQAYRGATGLVKEPLSFAEKNASSLHDLQGALLAILYPNSPGARDLKLTDGQREHLIKSMTARLSSRKNAAEHGPLTPGVLEILPVEHARYVSKSGRAYGFHLENAFVEDTRSKRGFFVAVVVYANPNGVLNDDDYAYDDLSKPLLAAVGKALTAAILSPKANAPRP